jgi:hypothetical protein
VGGWRASGNSTYLQAAVNNALAEKGAVVTAWHYADQIRAQAKSAQDEATAD